MATRRNNTAHAASECVRAAEPPVRNRVEAVRPRVSASISSKWTAPSGSMIEHLPVPEYLASLIKLQDLSQFDLNNTFDALKTLSEVGLAISCQPRCSGNPSSEFNDLGELINWHNEFIGLILDRCIIEARSRVPKDCDDACNRLLMLIERDFADAEYGVVAEAVRGICMVKGLEDRADLQNIV